MVGTQIMVDMLTKEPAAKGQAMEFVCKCIKDLPLTVVFGPDVIEYKNHFTVFAIIAESHLILSQYKNRLFIDLFSCSPISTDLFLNMCKNYFDTQSLNYRLINRNL